MISHSFGNVHNCSLSSSSAICAILAAAVIAAALLGLKEVAFAFSCRSVAVPMPVGQPWAHCAILKDTDVELVAG